MQKTRPSSRLGGLNFGCCSFKDYVCKDGLGADSHFAKTYYFAPLTAFGKPVSMFRKKLNCKYSFTRFLVSLFFCKSDFRA